MKILIIGFAKIKYMPYLNLYLENLDRKKNQIHLVYWNRDLKGEDLSCLQNITLHEFSCYQEDDVSKITKIGSFLKFRKFVRPILNDDFDFVVVLHSLPGIILFKELMRKYKNRYIFDFKDFTYENLKPYRYRIHSLVKNSYKTFVSSDAFRRFLPVVEKDKILTSHNIIASENYASENNIEKADKIRISFWGFIREEKVNKRIIDAISDDKRFALHYYGREQNIAERLKKYAEEKKCDNVFFHGEYNPKDRYEIIKNTDVIHNIFTEENMLYAMSNKYYDGIKFEIPQIVYKGSFMAQIAEGRGTGKGLDPYSSDFTQKIYDFYVNSDRVTFTENCREEMKRVSQENEKVTKVIRELF